jgi:hypothetical protein
VGGLVIDLVLPPSNRWWCSIAPTIEGASEALKQALDAKWSNSGSPLVHIPAKHVCSGSRCVLRRRIRGVGHTVGKFVPQNYPAIAVTTNGVHLYKKGKGMLLFAVRRATWM